MKWRAGAELVVIAALVAAGTAVAARQLSQTGLGVDDADIYLRYGRNIAQGLGVVWNPGGERVEGCTSWSWTAVVAIVHAFFSAHERVLLGISGVAVTLALFGSWRLIVSDGSAAGAMPGRVYIPVAFVALATWSVDPAFIIWTVLARLDTGLWCGALVLLAVAAKAFDRSPDSRFSRVGLQAAAIGVMLTRPEGVVFAIAVCGWLVVARGGGGPAIRTTMRALSSTWMAIAVTVAVQLAVRRWYFGEWLPNTYWAKVGDDTGLTLQMGNDYLRRFGLFRPWATAASVIAAFLVLTIAGRCLLSRAVQPVRAAGAAAVIWLTGMITAMAVGGDHFPEWRIMQPFIPFMVIVFCSGLARIVQGPGARFGRSLSIAVVLLGGIAATVAHGQSRVRWSDLQANGFLASEFHLSVIGRALGEALDENFPLDKPTVGVIAAGGLPYAYDGPSVDLMGLNDRRMARASRDRSGSMHGHAAFDAATFWSRPTDLVVAPFCLCSLDRPDPTAADFMLESTLRGLHRTPRFRSAYARVVLTTEVARRDRVGFAVYMRRDWLAKVRGSIEVRELAE